MTQEKIQKMKDFFLDALPEKLSAVLQEYNDFTAQPAPLDSKSFGAYHTACKNALSHMVLLMKMLQLLDENNQQENPDNWLEKARLAMEETNTEDE